jgi:hypothetical protein
MSSQKSKKMTQDKPVEEIFREAWSHAMNNYDSSYRGNYYNGVASSQSNHGTQQYESTSNTYKSLSHS